MKIELHEIPISAVVNGYIDNQEDGVVAYGGKLNVRPAYQREFIYKDKQRDEVIYTIRKGFPLNVMYWVKNGEDSYELMDGQQRTISLCQFVKSAFSIKDGTNTLYFHTLTAEEQQQILDYRLMIYICEGTDKEKLDWFKIINIAGEELTQQELRNAIYTGEWLTDAKKRFSKSQCPAYGLYKDYLSGTPIRQDYLETILSWIASKEEMTIEDYMALHQHDKNASKLWLYAQSVMEWVKTLFPHYRKEMKGLDWGLLYNQFGEQDFDPDTLEAEVQRLMMDDDVSRKAGIYEYLIDGKEKHLSIRAFSPAVKRAVYEKQKGICPNCKKFFPIEAMEADHITPWHAGGHTEKSNCQMLCKECNRRKSGK